MPAKTLTARFPGACRGCRGSIEPGDKIVNMGRGRNYHVDCDDPGGSDIIECYSPTTGNRWYINRNGRCEDAPCCGCCTS